MTLTFEDFSPGDTFSGGGYEMTEEEVRSFAEAYDPQPFHTDPVFAREESIYGGLIASGWHTAAVTMRLLVDSLLSETASLGARGVDELRFPRPVRPGDVLSIETEVLSVEPETDERGLVRARTETRDGSGELVFSMVGLVMVAREVAQSRSSRDPLGADRLP
ncbi:MaoC family dehydratase [Natronorarus salvus]|uniref:MaoC family dehydratase n=1 Tax=Natronorarus salvus TaxID=3117733 RepID=UPI002F26B63C